ncbi:MAG: CdaR family protein [Hydrogenoanaerobacterium sp.]
MSKLKEKMQKLFLNNTFLKIISLLLAFITYVIVAISVNPIKEFTVKDIPIIIDKNNPIIVKQGLNLLSEDITVADVKVSGKHYIVANLSEKDIAINASLSNVSGAGSYDLTLEPVSKTDKDFDFVGVTPRVVKVKFDKLLERKYVVEHEITNFMVPDGYIRLDEPLVTPAEITIKGPEAELNKISRVVVRTDLGNEPLSKTTVLQLPIELLNKNGDAVKPEEIKTDTLNADVKLIIHKTKRVPLTIDFTNVPQNFPKDDLSYRISNKEIWVAGVAEQIDNLKSINVGYIDLKTLSPENNVFNFDVVLPVSFTNIEHIENATVEFNLDGMAEKAFYVSDLKVLNVPADIEVKLLTKQIKNVTVVGDKATLNKLTASDIIGEIDLSDRKITAGQIEMPVKITVPGKGLVWSIGNYSAIATIKEK